MDFNPIKCFRVFRSRTDVSGCFGLEFVASGWFALEFALSGWFGPDLLFFFRWFGLEFAVSVWFGPECSAQIFKENPAIIIRMTHKLATLS